MLDTVTGDAGPGLRRLLWGGGAHVKMVPNYVIGARLGQGREPAPSWWGEQFTFALRCGGDFASWRRNDVPVRETRTYVGELLWVVMGEEIC